jgi:hypothetical protein
VKFFFDATFPPKLTAALKIVIGNDLTHHDEHFAGSTKDHVWLANLAKWPEVPVVISGDVRILSGSVEQAALCESGLCFFAMGSGFASLKMMDQCVRMFQLWEKIDKAARYAHKNGIFIVKKDGAIENVSEGVRERNLRRSISN